ncbi:DUF58 domain-containing protein [Denitrobaculum tricleocarpae]|uniref:DUF58 domain-containing protein n=1 Tax=Denitrobaculum tricleocarpae TaxID=2591009 RepID=A0A545U2A3_9PROT|nr:DUF58 domain-containing protein [Denitrobaculum tricleocarpae]TQV83533.1 DUF58 domain-containing protein [Denitrobaculum tricleocarpae]
MAITPKARLPIQQRAEQIASALPPLLVEAEHVATTVAQGVHGRRRVGQGETFWQFRRYESGDSPQSIDWRQSAKSDRVFVREMEWEAAQSVWIWRDTSASMAWSSSPELPEKRRRADILALALAVLLIRGGEFVTFLGSGIRPSNGKTTLERMAKIIDRGEQDSAGLPTVLPLPRFAQVVMISDFLSPIEEIEEVARGYASRGVKGHLLQILDPAEELLPYDGRTRFEGLEGEQSWLLSRVESVRAPYQQRFKAQREGLQSIAQRLSWGYSAHRSDHSPNTALLALYLAMTQDRGR